MKSRCELLIYFFLLNACFFGSRCLSVQETCLKTITILRYFEALKLHISFETFLMHLSVYPVCHLSPRHIYPIPPFPFMHMMHILNAASFSQSSYRCVTPPCTANSRGGVCKYIICNNQKQLHTYTHTLLIIPLEWYENCCEIGSLPLSTMNTKTPERPPTDHSSHITLRVGRAAVFGSVNRED